MTLVLLLLIAGISGSFGFQDADNWASTNGWGNRVNQNIDQNAWGYGNIQDANNWAHWFYCC